MPRILVVEDNDMIRGLLHATLSYGEHELVEAVDGAQALHALERDRPDVVILDLDLPGGLSGLDVLRRAKAGGAPARFMILTGSGRDSERALRSAGASAYMTKPFSPLALLAEVEALLPPRLSGG